MKNFCIKPWAGHTALLFGLVMGLTGCASGPKPADWQIEAKTAIDRGLAAYLEGTNRSTQAASSELARARAQLARTGEPVQLANAELLVCASRIASLDFSEGAKPGACPEFEPLRMDALPAQRAYADYLAGRNLSAAEIALLPPVQQAAARGASLAVLQQQSAKDPLALLVAAGVRLIGSGTTTPLSSADLTVVSDTASSQGWRRPLLAWLMLEAQNAERAGNQPLAERLQRRIAITSQRFDNRRPVP